MAAEFQPPVELHRFWNRKQIAAAIIKRQKADAKEQERKTGVAAEAVEPPNLEFEQALKDRLDAAADDDDIEFDKRGGPRPGSGRKPGVTADQSRVRNLPDIPNETVKYAIDGLFKLWAGSTKIPDVQLTEDELNAMAVPATKLQEYYAPGMVNHITWVWMSLATASFIIIEPRIKKVLRVQKERREYGEKATEKKEDAPAS